MCVLDKVNYQTFSLQNMSSVCERLRVFVCPQTLGSESALQNTKQTSENFIRWEFS